MENIKHIVPGTVQTNSATTTAYQGDVSFGDTLRDKIKQSSNLVLTKHAQTRVEQRNIDLSDENIDRLSEGVKIAEEKGLHAPLILIDRTAFIVNLNNRALVTTVSGDDMKNNAFTNIDGTVIV